MKLPYVLLAISAAASASACHLRARSKAHTIDTAASEAAASKEAAIENAATDLGADLPPVGRSVFDWVVHDQAGKLDVPYPLTALRQRLEAASGTVMGVAIIPMGRSLQKLASMPQFFQRPRVVLAMTAGFTDGAVGTGSALASIGTVYIGHVETAKQLEIISYNWGLGRYEFQVLSNYGSTQGKPTLTYARRSFCMSCHKNAGPIFTPFPWPETHNSETIAKRLGSLHGAKYDGFALNENVAEVNGATAASNVFARAQAIWRLGCGSDLKTGARCRGDVLLAALNIDFPELASTQEARLKALRDTWASGGAFRASGAYPTTSSVIVNFNPIEVLSPALRSVTTSGTDAKFKESLPSISRELIVIADERHTKTPTFFAETPSGEPIEKMLRDPVEVVTSMNFSLINTVDRIHLMSVLNGKTRKVVDALVAKTQTGATDVLSDKPFRRAAVLNALHAEAGSPLRQPTIVDSTESLYLPPAVLDASGGVSLSLVTSPPLRWLLRSCGSCHSAASPAELSFLHAKDEVDLQQRVKLFAPKLLTRIKAGTMPPKGTPEHGVFKTWMADEPASYAALLAFLEAK